MKATLQKMENDRQSLTCPYLMTIQVVVSAEQGAKYLLAFGSEAEREIDIVMKDEKRT